jgi:hypothetical protein
VKNVLACGGKKNAASKAKNNYNIISFKSSFSHAHTHTYKV